MPELQSCYFCGDIGDALTSVDVVPADLADESTQRTVVVCSTCQRKLDAVLAPLRNLATPGATGEADDDDSTTAEHGAPTEEAATGPAEATGADDADDAIDAESPLAPTDRVDESTTDAGSSEITFADAAGTSDESDDGIEFPDDGAESDEETDGADDTLLGGTDGDSGAALGGANEATADETETPSDDASTGDADADASGETEPESDEASTDDADADASGDDPPTGYRKVVRLLQNREFPVERASFVDLASNAYELDEVDVSASLDRLVERGALVESGGELQKP
jgi:hypothetical protein